MQNEKQSKDKIQQLTKTHHQINENVKRVEKVIRLVVSDKELISAFCTRINSALNVSERRELENFQQLTTQLDTMATSLVTLLNHLKELIIKEISQIDTSQTVLIQAHSARVQVNHHPQSAFKPIKPQQE